ncbi:type II inositol 3,4-bisphosphate 4-phosphatase-like isoform X3 [Gambusia affinis]|uniref:type II inositol 3,4-bisphosphate 4-phosphatase-like isoform X3 n=1 Tax=Gambusia affinis TaxID=33528 RepID=UPI001CDC761D|nr:type II inositol 3,4-bisphosphate 4-phosphatase-like isoform X3 [Gambusia affinis]
MNSLRRGFVNLMDGRTPRGERNNNLENPATDRGALTGANSSQQLLHVECQVAVAVATRVKIHVSTVDPYDVRKLCSTQIVKRSEDGKFRASVCCSIDSKLQRHSKMEVRVYREDDLRSQSSRNCLGFTSFSIRDLLRSKEPRCSLKLRTMDGVNEVGDVTVSRLQLEEETEDKCPENKSAVLCDALHGSVQDKENSPMMRAALCSQVCKLYRFQTEDHRWLLVREQMSETPLSFSLPKQLLSALIREHTDRVVEVKALGDLSPHWDGLRHDAVAHSLQLIGCYQQTQAELHRLSTASCFKASSSKSDRHLQFIPTNLHSQRMEVTGPDSSGVWYEVVTFGAPADHHQAFKHGGLKRLLIKHTDHTHSSPPFSRDESCRAKRLLAAAAQLQPLIFGLAEQLLCVSMEVDPNRLQDVLDDLREQTSLFIQALNDDLVKVALQDMNNQACSSSHLHSNGLLCEVSPGDQEGAPRPQDDAQNRVEEWDRTWANVGKSLDCITAMVERLQEQQCHLQEQPSPEQQESTGETKSQLTASPSSFSSSSSWQEQLLPLVVTLRDCVREAVTTARAAMTFVVLQRAVAATVAQGPTQIVQRRHAVFSQGLSAIVCGFMLKLFGGLEDPEFLQQLLSVGILAQFEGLLSTYGEEVGMLEDMEVGVADLSSLAFAITEAKSERPDDLQPTLTGAWGRFVVEVPLPSESFRLLPEELKAGRLIRVEPVLFNIGINQHQSLAERFGDSSLQERVNQQSCERLRVYCNKLREKLPNMAGIQSLLDLLSSLDRNIESKKRKNVEVLWLAASVCRKVNGVRLTSCKSAKDRTAMSVTLEQCTILREQHALSQQHFRSRLSWGQMLGCYAHSGFSVSGFDPADCPSGLQSPWIRMCFHSRRHFYPVAFLLVTSHLLVLWLIFSLVILLAKYQ